MRYPDCRRFGDRGVSDRRGFDLRGTDPFASQFDRVVGAPENVPGVTFDHRPVAVNPNVWPPGPIGFDVTCWILPEAARHSDPRLTNDQFTHDAVDGLSPVVHNVREFMDAFDALLITAGRNDRQVRAIAEEIERLVDERTGLKPLRVEGANVAQWVALDYGAVIVHVFDEETRDFYDLEHLWSAAPSFRRQRATSAT